MTERQLLNTFVKTLKKNEKELGIFVYKEPDDGRHKKPFDMYVVYKGIFIAIEAKKENEKLKAHQKEALNQIAQVEGLPLIARFRANGKHQRDIHFSRWIQNTGELQESWFKIPYSGGYNISHIFDFLIEAYYQR